MKLPNKFTEKKASFLFITLVILIIVFSVNLDVNPVKFFEGIPNIITLSQDAFPPNASIMTIAFKAMLETLQIAFLGTLFGMILSLPLGILASRNLFGKRVTVSVRVLLGAIRTMPSLLWAVIFVIMIGFGPFAGVLATVMYTMGYLGKLQYESIEGINPEPLEAISGIGTTKLQLIRFVVLPESANNLISQLLFMFEYNVRASTILGFVGAGGIGFYIMGYLRLLEYDKILTLLLIVLVTVLIIDYVSMKLRDRYLMH